VSDKPGNKAELDKDGIFFDNNKAELDKDGISLSDEEYEDDSREIHAQKKDTKQTAQKNTGSLKAILATSAAIIIILVGGGIAWHSLQEKKVTYNSYSFVNTFESEKIYSHQGDVILDPFMILYNSQNSQESGVLLAQISLQVTPEAAANVESNIFAVRNLILERLSANAEIYSKNELAEIIKQDLKEFKINDVAFIQYESR
jgi:flagellar basal body-associated protein FliL